MPGLEEVLYGGMIAEGEHVYRFESAFARAFRLPMALGTNSGTGALHIALLLADVGPGDEIITTSMTASNTYFATPSVQDIFLINADSVIFPTISGFEIGDSLKIQNLSESTGIVYANDPGNPPPVLTIGNAQVALSNLITSDLFYNDESFRQAFGSDAVIYA